MRSCLRNLGSRRPAFWWLLLSTGLMLFLFYLSSLQEPSTRLPRLLSRERGMPARRPAPAAGGKMPRGEGPQEKSVVGPGTTAGRGRTGASSGPSSPSPSPERKETPRPPGGQAAGATPAPASRAPRSSWAEQPRTRATEPARPPGKAARTPVPGSQDKARPSTGVRPASRAAETRAPPKARAQATPASGRARTPKAAGAGRDPGDEYSMDAGPPRTTCPDSLRVRAARSPWLGHLFLPNLTLFLDAAHLGPGDWERLRRFNPPFGFLDLNRSLVHSTVTRFPPGPGQRLLASLARGSGHCVRCAVVGNGGSLNGSRQGRQIDSHDYVFRVNGALTQGYEQDVGTRTSFYGFTAFSLTQSILSLGRRGFRHAPQGKDIHYLHFLENSRDYTWLEALLQDQPLQEKKLSWFRNRPREAFPDNFSLDRYHLLHPDILRYMKNRFLRSKTLDTAHWQIYRPTTGALLLLTALQLCDQVSAYGFITEGHARFSDHYFDTSWKKTVFYINHDFVLEKQLWKRLHEEGIIQLYLRP